MQDNQTVNVIIGDLGFDVNDYNEIKAGFSTDKKFKLLTEYGPFLLRISDINQADKRKTEFEIIRKAYEIRVRCAQPIKFGEIADSEICYSCFRFIEGQDAETKLPQLSDDTAFDIGKDCCYF